MRRSVAILAHLIGLGTIGLGAIGAVADADDHTGPTAGVVAFVALAQRTTPPLRRATFAFTGDTLAHSPVVARALDNGARLDYDFAPMFSRVAPIIQWADLAICHLETPVAPDGEPLSTFPAYGVPPQIATGLAAAGYDRCSTASNHSLDRGVGGVDATISALQAAGLSQMGMARSAEEASPSLLTVKGITVAHLSYAYGFNGFRLPAGLPWLANLIDVDAIIAAAREARAAGADVVIVSLHWGIERDARPTADQRRIAEALTASGEIDLIVGHHAHVIQPIEQINGVWVVFGLGNFLSNMPTGTSWPASTQDGVIVTVGINEQPDGTFTVERPNAVPTWVDRSTFEIHPVVTELADPELSPARRSALEQSLVRTARVIGDYVGG